MCRGSAVVSEQAFASDLQACEDAPYVVWLPGDAAGWCNWTGCSNPCTASYVRRPRAVGAEPAGGAHVVSAPCANLIIIIPVARPELCRQTTARGRRERPRTPVAIWCRHQPQPGGAGRGRQRGLGPGGGSTCSPPRNAVSAFNGAGPPKYRTSRQQSRRSELHPG